jgi:hypothetical protein
MSMDKVSFDLGGIELSRSSTRHIKGKLSKLIQHDLDSKILKDLQADPRYKQFIQSQKDKLINELLSTKSDMYIQVSDSTHALMVKSIQNELK